MQKIAMQTLPKPEWTERSYHRKASRSDFPTGLSVDTWRIAPAAPQLTQFSSCIYPETSAPDSSAAFLFSRSGIFASPGRLRQGLWSPSQKQRMDSGKIATASPSRTQSMAPLASSQRQKISGVRFWAEKASMINFHLRYKIGGYLRGYLQSKAALPLQPHL